MDSNLTSFVNILIVLIVIILSSRLFGKICTYFNQPRVLGEIIAGILLGPTFLGFFAPNLHLTFFSESTVSILFILSNLGLAFYMFLVGLEVDLVNYEKKFIKNSSYLALSGFLFPFICGLIMALIIKDFFFTTTNFWYFATFIAIAMSMTAFPILARILHEKNLINSSIGKVTLLAASIIDLLGWTSLAVLTAFIETNSVYKGIVTIISVVIFVLVLIYIIKPLIVKIGQKTELNGELSQSDFALIIALLLAAASFTDYVGIHCVFGGFILGLIMPKNKKFKVELKNKLEFFVVVFLVPIFFTYSGINTQFIQLNSSLFYIFLLILFVAVFSKYFSSLLGMRIMKYSWRESSAVGSLMNARGLMELIILNIGLSYGIISKDLFTLLVWVAIITTAMASPMFNLSFSFLKNKKLRKNVLKFDNIE